MREGEGPKMGENSRKREGREGEKARKREGEGDKKLTWVLEKEKASKEEGGENKEDGDKGKGRKKRER